MTLSTRYFWPHT